MDQEFIDLVSMAFESGLQVEIIYEAIKLAQESPCDVEPKFILESAIREWYK